jgi:hypothetical protein
MRIAHFRLAALLSVCSLVFGAAACAPADDGDSASSNAAHETTLSHADLTAAALQNAKGVFPELPEPADMPADEELWSEEDKDEKDVDCCVIKDSLGQACACFRLSGSRIGNTYNCAVSGGTKRGSGCASYGDCNPPRGVCGF